MTAPLAKRYILRVGWLRGETSFFGAFDRGKKMIPHGLTPLATCFIGIRAELNAAQVNSDHTSRVLRHCLQQKNELLAKEKLRQKRILEEVHRKHFPDVPLAVPPCQLPKEIPCKTDPKRASVNKLCSRAIQARDFERHATQRGCNFHSPELTVWSELCHVPSAQQAALVWINILF